MKKHIVYCWELGMGYGHVSRMDDISHRGEFENCQFTFALREIHKSHAIKKCHDKNLYQAPIIDSQIQATSPNFSHLMSRCGWDSFQSAKALMSAWRNLLERVEPDCVLLDHAPSAGLAAISLGIPTKQIGNGFEIPPTACPMPSIQPYATNLNNLMISADKQLNKIMEEVENYFAPSCDSRISLEALFNPENALITGSPLLDHYGAERTGEWRYLEQRTEVKTDKVDLSFIEQSTRKAIFFYLDARTPGIEESLKALGKKYLLFGFMSYQTDPQMIERLRGAGIKLFDKLLNVEQAFNASHAVICNAGVGLLNNVLVKAKPAILLPLHVEQAMVAYQVYQQKLALVLNNQYKLTDKVSLIDDYMSKLEYTSDTISQAVTNSLAKQPFWKGNLLEDFILQN